MDAAEPRPVLLGTLKLERGLDVDAIASLCDGSKYALPPLASGFQLLP